MALISDLHCQQNSFAFITFSFDLLIAVLNSSILFCRLNFSSDKKEIIDSLRQNLKENVGRDHPSSCADASVVVFNGKKQFLFSIILVGKFHR